MKDGETGNGGMKAAKFSDLGLGDCFVAAIGNLMCGCVKTSLDPNSAENAFVAEMEVGVKVMTPVMFDADLLVFRATIAIGVVGEG